MKLNTAIAIAVAAAFAAPFAAQASAEADRIILAQTSGKITTDPKDSNPAAPPATTGTPRSADTTSDRPASGAAAGSTTAPSSTTTAPAGAGATSRGSFSSIDKNGDGHISRDEAKDATWANRFTELDKDNDGRLSQSEFDAMQAGAGATGSTGAPVTSGTNAADRKPSTPKQ
jgi:EF hand domain-containing protein